MYLTSLRRSCTRITLSPSPEPTSQRLVRMTRERSGEEFNDHHMCCGAAAKCTRPCTLLYIAPSNDFRPRYLPLAEATTHEKHQEMVAVRERRRAIFREHLFMR